MKSLSPLFFPSMLLSFVVYLRWCQLGKLIVEDGLPRGPLAEFAKEAEISQTLSRGQQHFLSALKFNSSRSFIAERSVE